jgi:hypothetical protein
MDTKEVKIYSHDKTSEKKTYTNNTKMRAKAHNIAQTR